MKKLLKYILVITIIIVYVVVSKYYGISIPCLFHEITNLYCPGCGITRMIYSIINFDFYQAYRYNPLMFIFTPIILVFLINYMVSSIQKRKPLISKIPNKILYITIIILIIYGIMRNIPYFDYLKPTII